MGAGHRKGEADTRSLLHKRLATHAISKLEGLDALDFLSRVREKTLIHSYADTRRVMVVLEWPMHSTISGSIVGRVGRSESGLQASSRLPYLVRE